MVFFVSFKPESCVIILKGPVVLHIAFVSKFPDQLPFGVVLAKYLRHAAVLLSSLTISDMKDFWKGGVHKNCGVSIVEVKDGQAKVLQENVIYYDEKRSTNYFE